MNCKYQLPCGWCELRNQLCNELLATSAQTMKEDWADLNSGLTRNYEYECCKRCSNNPANGGSGICNCTLPYFESSATDRTVVKSNLQTSLDLTYIDPCSIS